MCRKVCLVLTLLVVHGDDKLPLVQFSQKENVCINMKVRITPHTLIPNMTNAKSLFVISYSVEVFTFQVLNDRLQSSPKLQFLESHKIV